MRTGCHVHKAHWGKKLLMELICKSCQDKVHRAASTLTTSLGLRR